MTGKPISLAATSAASTVGKPPSGPLLPGTTGTPALVTVARALVFSPIMRIALAGGPMNVMPAAAHASAKSSFSDRNPVSWMHRIGAALLARGQDLANVQVTLTGRRSAEVHGTIGGPDMQGAAVGVGVHGHRLDAKLPTSAHDPDRDFAAVGHQHAVGWRVVWAVSTCAKSTVIR